MNLEDWKWAKYQDDSSKTHLCYKNEKGIFTGSTFCGRTLSGELVGTHYNKLLCCKECIRVMLQCGVNLIGQEYKGYRIIPDKYGYYIEGQTPRYRTLEQAETAVNKLTATGFVKGVIKSGNRV